MFVACSFFNKSFADLGFNILFLCCLLLSQAMWKPWLWYRLVIETLVLQADAKKAEQAKIKTSCLVKIFFMFLFVCNWIITGYTIIIQFVLTNLKFWKWFHYGKSQIEESVFTGNCNHTLESVRVLRKSVSWNFSESFAYY